MWFNIDEILNRSQSLDYPHYSHILRIWSSTTKAFKVATTDSVQPNPDCKVYPQHCRHITVLGVFLYVLQSPKKLCSLTSFCPMMSSLFCFHVCVAFCFPLGSYRVLFLFFLGTYRVLSDLSDLATTIYI